MTTFSKKYPSISKYNDLWEKGEVLKPIVLLVGGYAGTGKSTLVKEIAGLLGNVNVLPTGIIRSVLRGYLPQEKHPYLYSHTYDFHRLIIADQSNDTVIELYKKQIKPIAKSINEIINFASTEKQHWIIDGNHIFPETIKKTTRVILFEIYLKVTDPNTHRELLGGPTHNRKIDDGQFSTARKLHDYTVEKVAKDRKPLYEYDRAKKEALTLINQRLYNYLTKKYD
jgi:2-phosphoglycerate kinase